MTFFFDNNISPTLVEGLKGFGEDVCHLKDYFPEDTPDPQWLKAIGQNNWILITRDKAINRRPVEKQAIKQYKLGSFFMLGKDMDRWAQVKQMVIAWKRIKEYAAKSRKPFAYKVYRSGRKIEPLPLD